MKNSYQKLEDIHKIDPEQNKNQTIGENQIINTQLLNENDRPFYLPVINCKIGGENITCLVDSGASVSIVEESFYEQIKKDPLLINDRETLNVRAITGHDLQITSSFKILVNIANKKYLQKFFIVRQDLKAHYRAILGFDFIQQNKIIIDLHERVLKTNNNLRIPIKDANMVSINSNNISYARLMQKCTLYPKENKDIEVYLEASLSEGDKIKLSPTIGNNNIKLLNDTTTVTKLKTAWVTLLNKSHERLSLNKGTKVASIVKSDSTRNMTETIKQRIREFNPQELDLSYLPNSQQDKLMTLLQEFADIFSSNLETIGITDKVTPHFEVDRTKLKSNRVYPVPESLKDELKRQLDSLIKADIIEKSESSISHPVILVKKISQNSSDISYRMVVDYRSTNAAITYKKYSMPLANHLLERLRGSKIYTSLDLQSFLPPA